ncbi:MAG: hypothetical protein AB7S38_09115 [Vulcanimicrobiota bacterium]
MDPELVELLRREYRLGEDSVHGYQHWQRVECYGLYLARQTGADPVVVRCFAYFHDCQRQNEDHDPGHGLRGGERARQLRTRLELDDEAFETLFQACAGHTDLVFSHDPTIATCWDSDRLDLDRVGLDPDPAFLSTPAARRLAELTATERRRRARWGD